MSEKPELTVVELRSQAARFAQREAQHSEPSLYGVTDGKAVGTYLEHKFMSSLANRFVFARGSSAKGIDFPALAVDIKVTSIRQPQSSCPFTSAHQKVFGLGYSLLVFVYEKTDDHAAKAAQLNVRHVVMVEADRTADFQLTREILRILDNEGNQDDLVALMHDKLLPVDDIQAGRLAEGILARPPIQGYLTISNALQWRLQYRRVIEQAGNVPGIERIL